MAKMTPSEALVETLVAEGVKDIFGIVGSAFMDALDLFPAAGIRFIPVAHEQAAAHAADGYARVTGRPQACIAQNGPGAANFVSAITAAFWAHSPVVAITPETGSMGIGTGGFQELDQMPWFEKSTKYQVRVNRPERMAELTRRCFYMAKYHCGPTQLNIPRDYFYGDINCEIYKTKEVSYGGGTAEQVKKAAELLMGAKYPVILAGGGVSMSDAIAETKALAEYLTAPVVNTYLHNDSFPADHELAVGPIGYCGSKAAMRSIAKADVVLALGTRLGPFGTLPQYDIDYWPKNAKLIQVDIDGSQLGLSKSIDLGVMGDAKEFAAQLIKAMKAVDDKRQKNSERLSDIAKEKATWGEELDKWSSSTNKLMHPRRFIKELSDAIPKGSIVATDIGNNSSICNAYLKFDGPRQHISALSWGNCGFAYGAALGAKMAAPNKAVFALQGDGAYGISGLSEVMTAVREKIPVIAVVFNNHEWGAEKKNQIDFFDNRFVGADLPTNPDYALLAKDMGALGFKVENYADVKDVVNEAVKSGKPAVINAVIEGGANVLAEPFRRDAFKPAVRYLDKYKHLSMV
ncbi:MAG TPA: sulfoacetaldehyde acetyltransferase [Spirochaetota bacterium]|nr:sulfoacetaldehyde acetyltransferase [Spirochaetota bacterium]HQP49674.1 sulfoacetaldehyde acetyltransferase [Spirochaetota bacterium]